MDAGFPANGLEPAWAATDVRVPACAADIAHAMASTTFRPDSRP